MATTVESSILATLVFLPGKSHGQRSLAGYSSRGHKELDMTEQLNSSRSYMLQHVIVVFICAFLVRNYLEQFFMALFVLQISLLW